MKSKKRLGFVSALLGVCLSVTSFAGLTAFADETETTSPNYEVKVGCEDIVSFLNPIDYFTVDGKEPSLSKIESIEVFDGSVALVEGEDFEYKNDDGEVEYLYYKNAGVYTLKITYDGTALEDIIVTVKEGPDAPVYDLEKVNAESVTYYEAFKAAIIEAVAGLDADDEDMTIPADAFWKIVDLDVYSSKHVMTKVNVAKGGGSFNTGSWNSSLSDITLGETGTYAFYIEVKTPPTEKNPNGFELTKDADYDLKIGEAGFPIDGWYTIDDPDTVEIEEQKLVIPVFTFEYRKVVDLSITISRKATALLLQEYTHLKVTVNNANSTVITLLYNANVNANAPTEVGKDGWVEATEDHADFGTLTTSSTKFTPKVKGAFAVMVYAKGGEGDLQEETAFSTETIKVVRSIQAQKLVNLKFRNFVKNNWLSLVFLGIALLCLVGIVVLYFYNPSDDEPKKAKKEKVEDEDVVVEDVAEDTVEEVEETTSEEDAVDVEETADEEESVEESFEEVAEEEVEEKVEEVTETTEEKAE